MPVKFPDTQQERIYILGKDHKGVVGAPLGPGQQCAIVSADPLTVTVAQDAVAQPTQGVDGVPDGTPSVASAVLDSPDTVANPNQPISLTATVTDGAGNVVDTTTDTAEIAPGTQETIGEAFGAANAVSLKKK